MNLDELYQQHFGSVLEKLDIQFEQFKKSLNPPRTEQFITQAFIQKLINEKDQLLYHIDDMGMHLISAKDLLISRFNNVKETFTHSPYQNFFDSEDLSSY